MSTLYLHIGTPKTGTTAIQSFCRGNRRALARRGCCYPIFVRGEADNGRFLKEASLRLDGASETREGERCWHAHMDVVARCLRRHSGALLSEEGIWNAPSWPGVWRRLRREADAQGYRVRVIVYLRRQDDFLSSWWAQKVKT